MTKMDMSIKAMEKLLQERGWVQVSAPLSGIFQKNLCYFVMYPSRKKLAVLEASTDYLGVCAELMVHQQNKGWYVEKDGFLIASGSLGRFISDVYEFGASGSSYEKTMELVEQVDSFACMSDIELMGQKHREVPIESAGAVHESISVSNLGIGTTKMFIANPNVNENILKVFERDVVYQINSIDQTGVTIYELSGKSYGKVRLDQLAKLEENGNIVAVSVKGTRDTVIDYDYKPMILGQRAEMSDEFNEFNLSVAQKAILAAAMQTGTNFTPFLDNRISVNNMKIMLRLVMEECDCKPLIGKNLDTEHLEFLTKLSKNKYPIDAFCDNGTTVEALQNKYSEMLSGLDYSLPNLVENSECIQAVRTVAMRDRGYQHVLDAKSPLEVLIRDDSRIQRFAEVGDYLCRNGIESSNYRTVSWVSVSQNMKEKIKRLFLAPGMQVNGKEWNYYFEDVSPKIIDFKYAAGLGFLLTMPLFCIGTDSNSIFLMNHGKIIFWRSVYVNEKYYYYCSDLVNDLL